MAASVFLVHGMWYGAWCYDPVLSLLAERGIAATAIDLTHSGELDRDVDAVTTHLDRHSEGIVLLGHSYGGVVITEAAAHNEQVGHLVYLSAFMPDADETMPTLVASVPDQPLMPGKGLILRDDGTSVVDPARAMEILFNDCEPTDALNAIAQLQPERLADPRPPADVAWRETPSTYVRCTHDNALSHTLQQRFAGRATNSVEWPTSHSPFISRPNLVADLLSDIASQGEDNREMTGFSDERQ